MVPPAALWETAALTRLVRGSLLVLLIVLSLASTDAIAPTLLWCALFALAAAPGLIAPERPWPARIGWLAEVIVVSMAAATPPAEEAFVHPAFVLSYLAAPAFAVGAVFGAVELVALVAVAIAALLVSGALQDQLGQDAFGLAAFEWTILAAVAGTVGLAVRRLIRSRSEAVEPEFVQAARLLTQLRTIARQLPGTLDPGSLADRLLDELERVAPADRSAVLTGSGGGRLEVLTQRAPGRVAWETSFDADTPLADTWASQQPQVSARTLDRAGPGTPVSVLVLPMITGVRTVGLVVLETDRVGAYSPTTVTEATEVVNNAALRLETALLFDEVRGLATVEERQRLAREIHDGVAQELVMVGYGIDNAIADLPEGSEAAESTLRLLRVEVTRVITELRLSLFELRSDVDRHGGLGSAIADYARTIGSSAGLRVHLSLDESTARLPAAVESELLRIAQEAVTNARKHAGAANLWVTCEVDPPYAQIEVSDDGKGLGRGRPDGRYGMTIMAERANRVRAELEIVPRAPKGTTVRVVLGGKTRQGTAG
ncbi:GAF domain-containing sensor histidine kinase [Cryptosporangium aurantiacum]|uniref:Signal transduction histidine kinase n=1 Tax=Cryptosporangium aurantiacum TaxID=134849 RepID=A0A1M7R7V1_9ACTN|nr:GAF domain-containing sensor histidine kinase [Cryptosporangium aurantiacum]SHN42250.1 Signal transduction histidine kinase [Cryptosporangium aurantiacum]